MSAGDVERLKTAFPTIKIEFKPLTDEEGEATLVKKLCL